MRYGSPSLTIDEVMNRYPDGAHIPSRGCYYFFDYDGDLGYFRGLRNGKYEGEVNYVDTDTMSDEDREETINIIKFLRDE